MKALTLTQPWASLVALQEKRIETRSWRTNYRGEMIIHAAKGFPKWAKELCDKEPFKTALRGRKASDLPVSQGLCVVRLVGCFKTEEMHKLIFAAKWTPPMKKAIFGDFSPGRFAWLTEYVKPLDDSWPRKGAFGLWEWNPQQSAEDALMDGKENL